MAATASNNKTTQGSGSASGSTSIYEEYFAEKNPSASKSINAIPTALTPEYFIAQTTRIQAGDAVFFNKYGSSTWFSGTILEVRNNGYYEIQYKNKKGNLRSEIVNKNNIILGNGKRIVTGNFDIKENDIVYFFTNFDKLITYGRIMSIGNTGVTIQRLYMGSENHTVPISAILIPDF